jgi:ribosomal protein L11 methyltransferase
VPRLYPALDVTWSLGPDGDRVDLLLAEIDSESPTAVEMRDDGLRLFFPSAVARGRAAIRLVAFDPTITCEPVEVSDEDWAVRSQSALGAIRIGRVVITPPWSRTDVGRLAAMSRATGTPDTVTIIQPSMGFGTGHHASTRLCLQLLQDLLPSGAAVLDVGTGSGVLAIAASKLGAARVVAIDNDEDALASARGNVQLNGLERAVSLNLSDASIGLRDLEEVFDAVLANLTGPQLVRLAEPLAARLEASGVLIAGGVTADEAAEVATALTASDLEIERRVEEDGWVGLALRRTTF